MTLSLDFLLDIHKEIKKRFGTIENGRTDEGCLMSIAERPFLEIRGQRVYKTVFEQAAVLMEGIIRGHPFTDGNKRTAFAVTHTFLSDRGYHMIIPPNIIRYMVSIASNESRDEESVNKLIKKIADWLEKRTATNQKEFSKVFTRYLYLPGIVYIGLVKSKIGIPIAMLVFSYWMCTKTHPEYAKGVNETVKWFTDLMKQSALSLGTPP